MKHELDRMMRLINNYTTGYGGVTDSYLRKELEAFAKDYNDEQINALHQEPEEAKEDQAEFIKMKDNYKAKNLKIHCKTEEEAHKILVRANRLGYKLSPRHENIRPFFFLSESGELKMGDVALVFESSNKKQITVKEFLSPQRGEVFKFGKPNGFREKAEFYMDLGEDAPNGLRYMTADGKLWSEIID